MCVILSSFASCSGVLNQRAWQYTHIKCMSNPPHHNQSFFAGYDRCSTFDVRTINMITSCDHIRNQAMTWLLFLMADSDVKNARMLSGSTYPRGKSQ